MRFLSIFAVLIGFLAIVAIITQIVWPVLQGRPPFPFFRKRRKIERRIIQEHEFQTEDELKVRLDRLKEARLAREKQQEDLDGQNRDRTSDGPSAAPKARKPKTTTRKPK